MTDTQNQPFIKFNTQYIKDLSFENPNFTQLKITQNEATKVDVTLDLEAKLIKDEDFEVTIKLKVTSSHGDQAVFVVDLSFAGIFTLHQIPDDHRDMVLLVHCPTLLFPYARRIVSDVTRDGGFQPLLLDPVDFNALHQQRLSQQQA